MRVLNLALGVIVTALVTRLLSQAGYGQWSTIFIVLTLAGYLTNFGMETVVVREAAREPEREHEWLGAMTLLRMIVVGPMIVVSIAAVLLLQESQQMLVAGLILIVAMPFGGVGAVKVVFQLRVNNLVPMLVMTLRSILWAGAVAIIYLTSGGMVALAIAMVAINSLGSVVQLVAALRLLPRWPRPSRTRLRPLLGAAMPLGIAGMLVIAYARIDQVIVYSMAGSRSAGLYGSVYTVLDQAHFVPISILTTLAPIIAASWPADRYRMLRAVRLTAELMAITSLGALAFACVASEPLVRLFFGASFVAAAPALPVLGAAFVFICFGYLNGNLMAVLGLQRRLLLISLVALVVNVIGNLILVPLIGFMGAAWMTLATEIVVFGSTSSSILKRLELPLPRPGRVGRTVLAAVLLAGALVMMRLVGAQFAVLALAACVCYPVLLFGLRALSIDDVRVLLRREKLA